MLESAPNSKKTFVATSGETELHEFPKPKNNLDKKRSKEVDMFAEAQRNLINEKMFSLFVRAVTDKETTGSTEALAFIRNRVVQECINLPEKDTVLILDQFNRSVRNWFLKKYGPLEINSKVYQGISSGDYTKNPSKNIDAKGTQSMISFLNARTKLLGTIPAQNYSFYFSAKLDSRHSIDIIEEIENNGEPIISLFQIKSSPPSKEELVNIHKDHEMWVKEEWIDLKTYEHSYISEGTEDEINQFLANKEQVETALMDFCTDPEGQSLQNLLTSLHLYNIGNQQQAWILWKYIDLLKEQLDTSVKDGMLEKETTDLIWVELSNLKEKLGKKAHLPKSQSLIKKVRSIVSVGTSIISEKEIGVGNIGKVMNIR